MCSKDLLNLVIIFWLTVGLFWNECVPILFPVSVISITCQFQVGLMSETVENEMGEGEDRRDLTNRLLRRPPSMGSGIHGRVPGVHYRVTAYLLTKGRLWTTLIFWAFLCLACVGIVRWHKIVASLVTCKTSAFKRQVSQVVIWRIFCIVFSRQASEALLWATSTLSKRTFTCPLLP